MSTPPGPAMELLGRIAYELHKMRPLIPTYIHLLASAVFPIYTAAHASLARPHSAAPAKKKRDADVTELQDEEISPTVETLRPSDAILFPLLAGATLASLYFILKWLQDPALLNYYLGLYFAVVGLFFQVQFIKGALAIARSVVFPNQYSYRGKLWMLNSDKHGFTTEEGVEIAACRKSPLPGIFSNLFRRRNSALWTLRKFLYTRLELKFKIWKLVNAATVVDTLDIAALVIATPLGFYHAFVDKPWFLTNTIGFAFCYGSLQMTTPGTSWTGSLLLSALFFYDIYFVFYTPMMITVATKLDVPIKLLFPRPDPCQRPKGAKLDSEAWEEYLQCLAKKRTMAMLGLGDIVIPGIMLAFALRFDLYLYYRKLAKKDNQTQNDSGKDEPEKVSYLPATGSWGERFWTSTSLYSPELQAKIFPKTYFNASVVGYICGMIATVIVMQIFDHGQPALLYLVPGVLFALWGTALVRGDFKALWSYSEVPEDEKSEKDEKQLKSKEENNDNKDDESKNAVIEGEEAKDSKPESPESSAVELAESTRNDTDTEQTASDGRKSSDKSKSTNKESQDSIKDDDVFLFSLSLLLPKKQTSTVTKTKITADDGTDSAHPSAIETSPPTNTENKPTTKDSSIIDYDSESEPWSDNDASDTNNDDVGINNNTEKNQQQRGTSDSTTKPKTTSHTTKQPSLTYPPTQIDETRGSMSTSMSNNSNIRVDEPATTRRRKV